MEEYHYEVKCILCNTVTLVVIEDENEQPAFCPMCGNEFAFTAFVARVKGVYYITIGERDPP